jgi:hypothetical protein
MRFGKQGTLEFILWFIVFAITAIFQFWRQVPEDGVMFCIALVALTIVWRKSRDHIVHHNSRSLPLKRSLFLWSAIAVLTALWELASYIIGEQTGRDYATPTISMLVAPFIAHTDGLIFLVVVWLILGYFIIGFPRRKRSRGDK